MLLRVFVTSLVLTIGSAGHAAAADPAASPPATTPPTTVVSTAPDDTVPDDTVNDFLPEDRPFTECISAAPKPGCGSKANGGWHQYLVLIALVCALTFVGWRIVSQVRRKPGVTGRT